MNGSLRDGGRAGGGIAKRFAKNQFAQRTTASLGNLDRTQLLWQPIWFAQMAERYHRHRIEFARDSKKSSRAFGVEPRHLVQLETHGRGLDAKAADGQPDVMPGMVIV